MEVINLFAEDFEHVQMLLEPFLLDALPLGSPARSEASRLQMSIVVELF